MTIEQAKEKLEEKYGDSYKVGFERRHKGGYIFLANNMEEDAIPSKLVLYVNAENGKIGASPYSIENAVNSAR